MADRADLLSIGFVVRAHGVQGAVRVRTSDAILDLRRLLVGDVEMEVVSVQPERSEFLLRLRGIDDRDQAEALKGKPLLAWRSDLPALADDELYVHDLIGCLVVDLAGTQLGEVTETFHSGAHELLTVRKADGGEFLLPFVDAIVRDVDLAARRITCDPPEGLIDG